MKNLLTMKAYNAAGNKILVALDMDGLVNKKRRKLGLYLKTILDKYTLDTAMVLFLSTHPRADFNVISVGKDGIVYEEGMCGNGARAIASFGYEYFGMTKLQLQTPDKNIITVSTKDGTFSTTTLGTVMELNKKTISTFGNLLDNDLVLVDDVYKNLSKQLQLPPSYNLAGIFHTLQEPHIVFVTQTPITEEDALEIVKKVMLLKFNGRILFPSKINCNFLSSSSKGVYEILTYERAEAKFTGSCGTGSTCSAAYLMQINPQRSLSFKTKSGNILTVTQKKNIFTLSGKVNALRFTQNYMKADSYYDRINI